ncbi:hypothetical protein VCR17J2_350571 [Vibrio coralliirubri]|nr:hypothetical protein VCR17J2_350571 [Vibrio coralliirubri]
MSFASLIETLETRQSGMLNTPSDRERRQMTASLPLISTPQIFMFLPTYFRALHYGVISNTSPVFARISSK